MFSDDLKQEFLENAFAMSAFAIAVTRVSDGVFVFANQSALDLFGAKDPSEVEGKTSIELGIWKNEARRLAFVASARAADDYIHTHNFTDRAGRKRARFLFSRFFEVDGVEYAMGASVDVTSMWEAEQALAGSEAKFSTLLTQSPTAVLITTWPAAEVVELNDACSQLLGIERDSIGQRPDGSFFADSEQFAEIRRCLSEVRVVNGLPVNLLHVDGHEVSTLLFCRRLTMNDERYVVTQIVDLSALQRVERELAASDHGSPPDKEKRRRHYPLRPAYRSNAMSAACSAWSTRRQTLSVSLAASAVAAPDIGRSSTARRNASIMAALVD